MNKYIVSGLILLISLLLIDFNIDLRVLYLTYIKSLYLFAFLLEFSLILILIGILKTKNYETRTE